MSALAEMERELIVERTRAGLAAAREQGRVGGRRRVMTTEVVERCRRMLGTGATRQQVAGKTTAKAFWRSQAPLMRLAKCQAWQASLTHPYRHPLYRWLYSATGADTDGMVGRIRNFGYATEEQAKAISLRS